MSGNNWQTSVSGVTAFRRLHAPSPDSTATLCPLAPTMPGTASALPGVAVGKNLTYLSQLDGLTFQLYRDVVLPRCVVLPY